ncbi:hypothetical protein C8R43DRAFT_1009617 [Mycena crocata]|nr:hypothetical protein C8R43DRAFT_1009617 [Mycena crocata]
MSSAITAAATADWDQPVQSTSARRGPVPRTVIPVSHDWEDDSDDAPEDNQRIWENANAQNANPMPRVIVSGSSQAALALASQPQMRILKRPTNAAPVAPPPPVAPVETLKEREARYQAARGRIFGTEAEADAGAAGKEKVDVAAGKKSPGSGVTRNPRGPTGAGASDGQNPAAGNGNGTTGFRARNANPPPPSPNPPTHDGASAFVAQQTAP